MNFDSGKYFGEGAGPGQFSLFFQLNRFVDRQFKICRVQGIGEWDEKDAAGEMRKASF